MNIVRCTVGKPSKFLGWSYIVQDGNSGSFLWRHRRAFRFPKGHRSCWPSDRLSLRYNPLRTNQHSAVELWLHLPCWPATVLWRQRPWPASFFCWLLLRVWKKLNIHGTPRLLGSWDWRFLRNFANSSSDTALQPKRLKYLTTPLWGPYSSHILFSEVIQYVANLTALRKLG